MLLHKCKLDTPQQIALVYRKLRIGEPESDREYWMSQPTCARLAALEDIRREVHGWNLGEEPRVEKVVTIIKRNEPASPAISDSAS